MRIDTIALIDETTMAKLRQDLDAEAYSRLLPLFTTELDDLGHKLSLAIEQQHIDDIQDIVHILKNSAALYGARPLAEISQKLHDNMDIGQEKILSEAAIVQLLCKATLAAYRAYTY